MAARSQNVKNVVRVNATCIDVTSSNTIEFGYIDELAYPGRIIAGRHRLHRPLPGSASRAGSGSCGSSLWRADSLWSRDPVLIELLDPAIAEDAALTAVFESEARAARAVSSPFVSQVIDAGVESRTPYLVTELASGETLADRLAVQRRPSFPDFVRLFRELARGVEALHAAGLLHRDLRSERVVLLSTPGVRGCEQPKLTLGISKLMNDTLELVRTMAHRAVAPPATLQYTSPEQVLGTAPLSSASDAWSLAVIAFECVTGELPFTGATTGEQLVQICTAPARVPSELVEVPGGFDAWFARGVEKEAQARWRSVREMADALAALG